MNLLFDSKIPGPGQPLHREGSSIVTLVTGLPFLSCLKLLGGDITSFYSCWADSGAERPRYLLLNCHLREKSTYVYQSTERRGCLIQPLVGVTLTHVDLACVEGWAHGHR